MQKEKRKTMSKKNRFEVFKRDNFQCAYCGKTPPEVTLEIDHIESLSKGGSEDIFNLITACFDCNRGKRDIPLNKIPASIAENIEALKEKELQILEYRKFIKKISRRENKDIQDISNIYSDIFTEYHLSENFKSHSLKKFLNLLPKHEVEEAMRKATSYISDPDKAIKYFCGICWNKIKSGNEEHEIKKLWKRLSHEMGRGIGYSKAEDIREIKGKVDIDEIAAIMKKVLSSRKSSYWRAFMEKIREI